MKKLFSLVTAAAICLSILLAEPFSTQSSMGSNDNSSSSSSASSSSYTPPAGAGDDIPEDGNECS